MRLGGLASSVTALLVATVVAAQNQAPFRSAVVLVPLDVRVMDRAGNPVTDLTAADFTILEDGVPQQIAHFATRTFTADGVTVRSATPDQSPSDAVEHRTFLIVLDRGLLNGPVKALDGLIDFVRTKLLPRDRVGVVAYLRVLELTTSHESIALFLERFRERYSNIEDDFAFTKALPVMRPRLIVGLKLQSLIDGVFDMPGLPPITDLAGAAGTRRQSYLPTVALTPAIEYLRHFPGEKHLIFVSEKPLTMFFQRPRVAENYYVQRATDARVALHLIHAGGVATPAQSISRNGEQLFTHYAGLPELLAPADLRDLSAFTGGSSAYYQDAAKPLEALDRSTRFQYLLGYYPTAVTADDQRRVVEVRVNRRDVTASYRHGYQARPTAGTIDDFRRSYVDQRISTSAEWARRPTRPGFPASPIRVAAKSRPTRDGSNHVELDVRFDAQRFTFVENNATYTAVVDYAVFVDGQDDKTLVEKRDQLELTLDAKGLERLKREWLAFTTTITAPGRPVSARVVVYEFESNRVLAAKARVR